VSIVRSEYKVVETPHAAKGPQQMSRPVGVAREDHAAALLKPALPVLFAGRREDLNGLVEGGDQARLLVAHGFTLDRGPIEPGPFLIGRSAPNAAM